MDVNVLLMLYLHTNKYEYMHSELEKRLAELIEWLLSEYAGIRTGQATPTLLDGVKVENYGSVVPINQVGTVGVENARTLRVSVWDADIIPAIERAIIDADLGVSVATDGTSLRVSFPELTGERREQLMKIAKAKLEEARVSVRGARDDATKEIDKLQKEGEISEDEKFNRKEEVQKKVEEMNKSLDQLFAKKEEEISQ